MGPHRGSVQNGQWCMCQCNGWSLSYPKAEVRAYTSYYFFKNESRSCSTGKNECTSETVIKLHIMFQVMSETVSKALTKLFGPHVQGTAKLIEIVDKFFDCLNVRNLDDAKLERKPFRSPYRCGTDWRLKV